MGKFSLQDDHSFSDGKQANRQTNKQTSNQRDGYGSPLFLLWPQWLACWPRALPSWSSFLVLRLSLDPSLIQSAFGAFFFFLNKHTLYFSFFTRASLVAQMVKHLPAMRETWVQFLGREDPLEKEMLIHSSTLAWKIPWTEEPNRLQSMGSQRVGHDWATSLSLYFSLRFF